MGATNKTPQAYLKEVCGRLSNFGYARVDNAEFYIAYKQEPSNVRRMLWIFAGEIVSACGQTPSSLEDYFNKVRAASLELNQKEFPRGYADLVIMPVLISDDKFSPQLIQITQTHTNAEWYTHELTALVRVEPNKTTVWRRAQSFQSWQLGAYARWAKNLDEILKPDIVCQPVPPSKDYDKLNFWWNLGLRKSKLCSK